MYIIANAQLTQLQIAELCKEDEPDYGQEQNSNVMDVVLMDSTSYPKMPLVSD